MRDRPEGGPRRVLHRRHGRLCGWASPLPFPQVRQGTETVPRARQSGMQLCLEEAALPAAWRTGTSALKWGFGQCHGNHLCGSAPPARRLLFPGNTLGPRGAHLQVPHRLSWPLWHVSDSSPSRLLSVEPPDVGSGVLAEPQLTAGWLLSPPPLGYPHPGCPGSLWQGGARKPVLPLPTLCALSSGPSWTHTCAAPKWGP